jgi:glycosyltransferase involved in cell wall biosynthesis
MSDVVPSPAASIVIPTLGRPDYLAVTLGSVVPQASRAGAEVVVVNDGADAETGRIAAGHGARVIPLPDRAGVNGARNAGIRAAASDVVILLDDDVEVAPGWLEAMLHGVRENPEHDVLGGPIHGRLENGPRACGREPPPISTYELGPGDHDVPYVFGGNTAFRKRVFERIGYFRDELSGRGDEEEWVLRYTSGGGRIRYLADASIDHRRAARDARLSALTRAAYGQGREARRHDMRVGAARPIGTELRILAGCVWHTARRRCAYGIVMAAKTAGSVREALAERRS